ncbi:MAG: GntR family transcriptional regulator [Rhodocyclaceae bacterium]|nr:MAG: GntR family transcriptional regulator [Rhodocyclaceae bacterium]
MVKRQASEATRKSSAKSAPKLTVVPAGKRGLDLLRMLRERIARQEVAPGAKLGENELSKEFCVPRAIVREAFCALEQRGLIERIPNRGAVVVRLDLSQVFHIYDTREVLEGLCARLATQNVPAESWQDLVEMFEGPMQDHVAQGDYEAFLAGYGIFRRRLLEAAANPELLNMLDTIYEKTQAVIRRVMILPGRAEIGLNEHRAVLAAMRRGDADEAERLRRLNMRSAKDCLKRYQNFVL